MKKVVILGGGLAGLSTALHLQRAGWRDYQLLEKDSRIGGVTRSEFVEGFTFDYTGHVLHFKDQANKELVLQLLGENIHLVQRNSWIFSKGVYTRYPFQTNTYGLPKEVIKECVEGFIEAQYIRAGDGDQMLAARAQPREPADESFEDWIYTHFGRGIGKHFMLSYNEKLWSVHPREMTSDWMGRFVPQTNLSDILDGALSDEAKPIGYNATFYYPLRGGIEALPRAFAACLPHAQIEVNKEVCEVDLRGKVLTLQSGEKVPYHTLVTSVPLRQFVKLIKSAPLEIRDAAMDLRHNSVFNVNLGIDRVVTDKHWIYFPEPEYVFYRVGCTSNLSPFMAPAGRSSLYIEVSYSDEKPIDKPRVLEQVKHDIRKAGLVKESDHMVSEKCIDIPCAYVIYDRKHKRNVALIREFLRANQVFTIGRYGAWEYSGMEDAIAYGRRTAGDIIAESKQIEARAEEAKAPLFSILIPIHNEEAILESAVREMLRELDSLKAPYEIVLCENGSRDRTVEIASQLATIDPRVRLIQCPTPNYGRALAQGILEARGENVVCFEIDYWDAAFVRISEALLTKYDAVIGSKRAPGSRDRRPRLRRVITYAFNTFLRLAFGFQGTDTHGIKAFKTNLGQEIVRGCQTDKDIFATELVLRMERAGIYICEMPLEIEEKRAPSIKLLKRVPSTVGNLLRLRRALRDVPSREANKESGISQAARTR
jgi:protoporphyrinogen oxidase